MGAIWIAYLTYPLLRILIAKTKIIVLALLIGAYAIMFHVDFFGFPRAVNPATFMLCFYIGMLLASNSEILDNIGVAAGAGLLAVIMLLVPMPGDDITKEMIIGLLLLISLNKVGEVLCKNDKINHVVYFVSSMSYYTFLLHHQLIYKILEGFNSVSTRYSAGVLIMVIAVTLIFSSVLSVVMKAIFASNLYRRLEAAVVRDL